MTAGKETTMADQNVVPVIICMGSSCFSRGNNRNIEVLQNCIASSGTDVKIEAKGHLCEGLCKNGPNIVIDGKLYSEVDPVAIVGLLNYHVGQKRGGKTT